MACLAGLPVVLPTLALADIVGEAIGSRSPRR